VIRNAVMACAAALLLAPLAGRAQSGSEALQKFFAQAFEERLREEPELATSIGRNDYDDRWNDWSKAGRDERRAHLEQRLKQLEAIPLDGATDEEKLSARLLRYDMRQQLDALDLETHLLRVHQLFGLHNRVYAAVDRMPARTMRDYRNLLARLHAVPAYVDQNIALMNESLEQGLAQPRPVVELILKQLGAQCGQTSANSPLLAAFRKFPSNFPAEEQEKLKAEAVRTYESEFLPAWRKLLAYMRETYAAKERPIIGLGSLPNGRRDYEILIHRLTTTSLSPEEIHRIGEAEVKRIEAEMLELVHGTGFTGSLVEFEKKLDAMPGQHFRSKEEMLAYCRNVAKIIEPELPNLFKRIPVMLYGVRAIPPDREQASASNAQAPNPDGSAPGWFNLNTYEPEKQVRYDKEALVLHEAVPGHIFQGSVARTLKGIPEFRKFYGNSAYGEGWALYAESLGEQLGIYRDAYSRFGRLVSERFRAVRLVVDTGIHAMGWTREQAVEYFRAHAPQEPLEEIDRYIGWPAQALSYKLGQLKILELRRQAENELGAKFDIREFHDVVLRDGTLPLELLQEQVQAYIGAQR